MEQINIIFDVKDLNIYRLYKHLGKDTAPLLTKLFLIKSCGKSVYDVFLNKHMFSMLSSTITINEVTLIEKAIINCFHEIEERLELWEIPYEDMIFSCKKVFPNTGLMISLTPVDMIVNNLNYVIIGVAEELDILRSKPMSEEQAYSFLLNSIDSYLNNLMCFNHFLLDMDEIVLDAIGTDDENMRSEAKDATLSTNIIDLFNMKATSYGLPDLLDHGAVISVHGISVNGVILAIENMNA